MHRPLDVVCSQDVSLRRMPCLMRFCRCCIVASSLIVWLCSVTVFLNMTTPVMMRHAFQQYEACIDYFSAETWVDFMSAVISTQCKADKVIHHVIALGLRNPTEGTLKILNSLTLAVCLGVEEAKQVSEQGKKAHLSEFKKSFKRAVLHLDRPPFECIRLPTSAAEFAQTSPDL